MKCLACAGLFCLAAPGFAGPAGFVLYSTTGGEAQGLDPNSLLNVDPASGAQKLAAQSGQAADLNWLTANPVNGLVYGTGLLPSQYPGGVDESTLYAINPNSGAIIAKVSLSQNAGPIAASPQGTLFGVSVSGSLGTVNTATGQFSSVGTLSIKSGYYLESIAFSPSGTLYGVVQKISGPGQQLITFDPATGAMLSDLGTLKGDLSIGDITFAPDGNIYATNFGYDLVKIDPQTLAATLVGFGGIGPLDGIASISVSSPEPGTLSLIPIALLGLLIRLRK